MFEKGHGFSNGRNKASISDLFQSQRALSSPDGRGGAGERPFFSSDTKFHVAHLCATRGGREVLVCSEWLLSELFIVR